MVRGALREPGYDLSHGALDMQSLSSRWCCVHSTVAWTANFSLLVCLAYKAGSVRKMKQISQRFFAQPKA